MSAMSAVYIQQRVWHVTRSHDLWHVLPTLKRTITKSTLHVIEGTAYLCTLHRRIAPGACATSTFICKHILLHIATRSANQPSLCGCWTVLGRYHRSLVLPARYLTGQVCPGLSTLSQSVPGSTRIGISISTISTSSSISAITITITISTIVINIVVLPLSLPALALALLALAFDYLHRIFGNQTLIYLHYTTISSIYGLISVINVVSIVVYLTISFTYHLFCKAPLPHGRKRYLVGGHCHVVQGVWELYFHSIAFFTFLGT